MKSTNASRTRLIAVALGLLVVAVPAGLALGQGEPIPAPADVAAAPDDAEKTASGLASKVLAKGTGTAHPGEKDHVRVHYTGWTTDGKMFDSSVARDEPIIFPLSGVIAGWTEGVQLMVEGEKRRFWIPEDLAYKGRPGAPAGMLVFDVELLDFLPTPSSFEAPDDAEKTEDGTAYQVVAKGTGDANPPADGHAKLNLNGWTADGQLINNSTFRAGKAIVMPIKRLPPPVTSALAKMVAGETRRIWIASGAAGAPPGGLVLDVELVEIKEPIPAPADVAAAPADAETTESGLASKVITAGTGDKKPQATSVVRVHYTGWTTDGKMFDSSLMRDEPTEFPLNRVISGWTEGLQLMVVGEKRRFWIPEKLAYQGKPGAPAGMLVFDVELLEIVR